MRALHKLMDGQLKKESVNGRESFWHSDTKPGHTGSHNAARERLDSNMYPITLPRTVTGMTILTNSMSYETRRFNAAFTRAEPIRFFVLTHISLRFRAYNNIAL